jgi:malate/lactate dehydrogenase
MITKKELEKLAQQVVNDGYETYKDKDETSVYLGMVIGVSKLMNLINKGGNDE